MGSWTEEVQNPNNWNLYIECLPGTTYEGLFEAGAVGIMKIDCKPDGSGNIESSYLR